MPPDLRGTPAFRQKLRLYCTCLHSLQQGAKLPTASSDQDDMSTLHHDGRKLPPGWVKCESAKYGTPYFFNTQTGKSVWFPPESPSRQPPQPAEDEGSSSPPPAKRSRQLSPPPLPPPSSSPPSRREIGGDAEGNRVGTDAAIATAAATAAAATAAAAAAAAASGAGLKVAVIVPYRDLDPAQKRSAHLSRFIPFMEDFLARQQRQQQQQQQQQQQGSVAAEFRVYVVEQSSNDGRKFNRGKLLNIGFDLARREGCGAFLFHDVDLLPSDELGRWYSTRPERPVHVARVWKQYSNNPKYFGGVVAFNQEDFEKINGFPNTFWGWGGEDDEMYSRIVESNLQPQKAEEGDFTDLEGFDLQTKLALLRKNEQWKCQVKQEALEEHTQTWRRNGLADLKYKVLGRTSLAERSEKVTVDVEFNGHWTDKITHWKDLHLRDKKP